jgi:ATPase subunit of ABC transporter with duplicated ATPase domains
MLIDSLGDFEGTRLFVSHDRAFLRALSNRVIELGGESGTDTQPHLYPGSYVEYVARTGHEAPGGIHSRIAKLTTQNSNLNPQSPIPNLS